MSPVLNYLCFSLWLTAQQLLLILAPLFIMAYLMHLSTAITRKLLTYLFGAKLYIYFTFIGVICHELGHAVFCLLFGHKLEKIKLIQVKENSPLGYVTHSYKKGSLLALIGNFFIGTGPIWFGAFLILILTRYLLAESSYSLIFLIDIQDGALSSLRDFAQYTESVYQLIKRFLLSLNKEETLLSIKSWAWLYLAFSIGSHISLSKPDIVSARNGLLTLVICLLTLNIVTAYWIGEESLMLSTSIASYVAFIALILGLVIAFNLIIAGALFLLAAVKKLF